MSRRRQLLARRLVMRRETGIKGSGTKVPNRPAAA
jgi:hypothetical protein